MCIHRTRFLAVMALVAVTAGAQSPWGGPVDPGPLFPDAASGFNIAAGYRLTLLADLSAATPTPECIELLPGGDIVFSSVAGLGCAPAAGTHLWRIPMSNGAPVAPLQLIQMTTLPVQGHVLAVDGAGNIYAAGTCDQTPWVWYLPAGSGVPQIINPTSPINDPDGIALGTLPGSAAPILFVAAQDQLLAIDVSNPSSATITPVAVNLSALGLSSLGNWGGLCWDTTMNTLLGSRVGTPSAFETIELPVAGYPAPLPASSLSSIGLAPLTTDNRAVRVFGGQGGDFGLLDIFTAPSTYKPLVTGLPGRVDVERGPDGSLYILEKTTASLYRLDPSFFSDVVPLSASVGGTANLSLRAPPGRGNEPYLVVASLSGASPGVTLSPTSFVPINPDEFTNLALLAAAFGYPSLQNWLGFLDGAGNASAALVVPPNLLPPGITIHMAYLLSNPPQIGSNATWVRVAP